MNGLARVVSGRERGGEGGLSQQIYVCAVTQLMIPEITRCDTGPDFDPFSPDNVFLVLLRMHNANVGPNLLDVS